MRLYLMRHAEAAGSSPSGDAERALTERGVLAAQAIGRALQAKSVAPTCYLTSPYRRAVQTATAVRDVLGGPPLHVLPALASSGMPPKVQAIEKAAKEADAVLVVGHMPDIGLLVVELTRLPAPAFSPGTIAALEPANGKAPYQLAWFLSPDQLLS